LSNAIKFSSAKEGSDGDSGIVSITLRKEAGGEEEEEKNNASNQEMGKEGLGEGQGEEVMVSITDNGEGIHPEILPRLFTKFATKSEAGGTGLGLYITKSIIETHGGRIWAGNNSDGKGATFSFSLPLSKKKKEQIPTADRTDGGHKK
jgi:signal transduction histidine kinase